MIKPYLSNLLFFYLAHSLDWSHYSQQCYDFDDFEHGRPERRKQRIEMFIPSYIRHRILINEWGCTMNSIMKAKKEVKQVQERRNRTACQPHWKLKTLEYLEMTRRGLKNAVCTVVQKVKVACQ